MDRRQVRISEAPDPLIGRILDDRYHVLHCIGKGGMGAVYLAEHVLIRRKVAIKTLHSPLSTSADAITRFHREAVAAAAIGNEHVVGVTDMGQLDNGAYYIVLEYLDGADVAWTVASAGPLSVRRSLQIALQLCDALAAVHAAGIVHRDLKPENLFLIARHGRADFLKVLDFGICKFRSGGFAGDRPLTATGATVGTPHFMAPEQIEGQTDIDQRADIYAVGGILYFALTGNPPFDAPALPRLFMRICEELPPALSAARPDVPLGLEQIVARTLAKRPEDRFGSAVELRAALAPLMASEFADDHQEFASRLREPVALLNSGVRETGQKLDLDIGRTPTEVSPASAVSQSGLRPSGVRRWPSRAALGLLIPVVGFGLWWLTGASSPAQSVQARPRPAIAPAPGPAALPETAAVRAAAAPKSAPRAQPALIDGKSDPVSAASAQEPIAKHGRFSPSSRPKAGQLTRGSVAALPTAAADTDSMPVPVSASSPLAPDLPPTAARAPAPVRTPEVPSPRALKPVFEPHDELSR